MDGKITITNKEGFIIFSTNIWFLLMVCGVPKSWHFRSKDMRVFIDGNEIKRPDTFIDDSEEGGEVDAH